MDRIADSGSADGGSNPSGHTKQPGSVKAVSGFFYYCEHKFNCFSVFHVRVLRIILEIYTEFDPAA